MARPTKYSEDRAKPIVDALKIGCTRKAAAEASGVCYETFREWLYRFPAFSVAVTRAEAEAEARFTARIAKEANAADGDWRAAESWLKRRRYSQWGDRKQVDIRDLSDDQLLKLARLLEDEGEGEGPQGIGAARSPAAISPFED